MTTVEDKIEVGREFLKASLAGEWSTLNTFTGEQIRNGEIFFRPDWFLEAFGNDGWGQVASLLANNFRPNSRETSVQEFREGFEDWQESFQLEEIEFENISAVKDNLVVYHIKTKEKHVDVYAGVSPTGQLIESEELGVLRVENENVSESYSMWGFQQVKAQLGITPTREVQAKVETQFYKVVNRVLRHNIRHDLNLLDGYAELIESEDVEPATYASRIRRVSAETLGTVEKIREIEARVLETPDRKPVNLRRLVQSTIQKLRESHPAVEIDVTFTDDSIELTTDESLLTLAVREALENAVEYNNAEEPLVKVEFTPAQGNDDLTKILVRDNGPGIPEQELNPLFAEEETALDHASGVGLWAIKWSIEKLGGNVEFLENEPSGSVVKMQVPDRN